MIDNQCKKGTVVVVYVVKTLDQVKEEVLTLVEQGYTSIEVTLRTDNAYEAISIIKSEFPELQVGAGTVRTLEQLGKCKDLGVDFCVSPNLDASIISVAKTLNMPFIPGVATPTEISQAVSLGLKLVKIFPVKFLGGVGYIKAISSVFPDVEFMPTGGVSESDSEEYLSLATVNCVGGTWMLNR